MTDVKSEGSENFDFLEGKPAGEKPAKKESVKAKADRLEKQIATSGKPTAEMIAEARKLSGSKKGLDIDKFVTKNRLINVDIEQLLHAPLNKDGLYA